MPDELRDMIADVRVLLDRLAVLEQEHTAMRDAIDNFCVSWCQSGVTKKKMAKLVEALRMSRYGHR